MILGLIRIGWSWQSGKVHTDTGLHFIYRAKGNHVEVEKQPKAPAPHSTVTDIEALWTVLHDFTLLKVHQDGPARQRVLICRGRDAANIQANHYILSNSGS